MVTWYIDHTEASFRLVKHLSGTRAARCRPARATSKGSGSRAMAGTPGYSAADLPGASAVRSRTPAREYRSSFTVGCFECIVGLEDEGKERMKEKKRRCNKTESEHSAFVACTVYDHSDCAADEWKKEKGFAFFLVLFIPGTSVFFIQTKKKSHLYARLLQPPSQLVRRSTPALVGELGE